MQKPRTTYNFSPELAALLEALLRQGHVARSDATRVNNNISVKVDAERKLKQANKRIANEHTARHFAKKEADRDREAKRAALESLNKLNSILGIPLQNIEYGPQATNQGTIQDGWQAKIDKAYSDYGMSNALGQMTNVSDAWRATPSFGRFMGKDAPMSMVMAGQAVANPIGFAGAMGAGYLGSELGAKVGEHYGNKELGRTIGSLVTMPFGYKAANTGFKYALEIVPIVARNYRLSTAIDRAVDNTKLPFGNNNYTTILSTLKTSPDTGAMVLYQRPQSKLSLAERTGVSVQDRDVWNPQVMNNAREFARKYGYEEPNSILDAKNMYRLHNRFFRTVNTDKFIPSGKGYHEYSHLYKPGMTELEVINAEFPEFIGMTPEQIKMQLASKGYPTYSRSYYKKDIGSGFSDDFVFVSPSLAENMDYAGNTLSNTILLQRPFSFGKPSEWHINADWRPSGKIYKRAHNKGEVSEGNSYFNHEAKVSTDHLIPVKIAETGDKGTLLGEFLNNNRGLLNNETQPILFINLEETFTPVTRLFVHPSEAVRKAYTAPNLERLEITTAEPLMSASKRASSIKGVEIPPSEFHPRKLSDGRYVINDPDNPGKSILWNKYLERTGQNITNLGYNPQEIAEQATKDFNNSILQRIINENKLLTDLADKIKSGKATTQFATDRRTIINPSSRDVLAGEYLDATKGKQTRGVGLVNTTPVEVTTTGEEVYAGRGNFGINSFSVTDSKRASTKYGAIDYEKLTNDTQHSKVLTDLEKNEIFDIMKRMKEIDKNPLPEMKDNTQGKFKVTPEEELEYISLGERLNELVPGTFEYGAKNRHILFRAPEEKLILDISSTSNNFGHLKESLGLNLFDYRNRPIESYTPAGNLKSGNFGNIVDAERTIGGYYKDSPLYGRLLIKGWNQSDKVMELLRLRYPHLFPLKIPKNYRFYVRGTGPNGVSGDVDMVTLQAPNGGIPGFKFGNKLNYYRKYKSKF